MKGGEGLVGKIWVKRRSVRSWALGLPGRLGVGILTS